MRMHRLSKVTAPVFDTPQPRSMAMIDRQSAMTGIGGGGLSDRE